ncbi:hypothetical protein HMPREF9056_02312 [Actinomyces sp. oral taxon 170 str. F0386]|nr:hypothetical protein HMPREF9056_02312 [Actinomyces sp. oral taxon 170 str. F0386]
MSRSCVLWYIHRYYDIPIFRCNPGVVRSPVCGSGVPTSRLRVS